MKRTAGKVIISVEDTRNKTAHSVDSICIVILTFASPGRSTGRRIAMVGATARALKGLRITSNS